LRGKLGALPHGPAALLLCTRPSSNSINGRYGHGCYGNGYGNGNGYGYVTVEISQYGHGLIKTVTQTDTDKRKRNGGN